MGRQHTGAVVPAQSNNLRYALAAVRFAVTSIVLLLISCGSTHKNKSDTGPVATSSTSANTAATQDTSSASAAGNSSEDCGRALDNMVARQFDDRQQNTPTELQNIDEERQATRAKLEPEFLPVCAAWPATFVECVTRAKTLQEIKECG